MNHQNNFTLVGMPESGKTTFIAAFWYFVANTQIVDALRMDRLEGDWSYLEKVRQNWLDLKELGRTLYKDEQFLTMHLQVGNSGEKCKVIIPDLSGERVRDLWSDRFLPKQLVEFFKSSNGVILFVHPKKITRPVRLRDIKAATQDLDPNSDNSVTTPIEPTSKSAPKPWDPELSPTQVILVDFLQNLLSLQKKQWKVSLVVSAWDTLPPDLSPEKFLALEMPLLWQFLQCSKEVLNFKIFGVSAQGGDLEKERKELEAIINPLERVWVVEGNNKKNHDLSIPLKWLMT